MDDAAKAASEIGDYAVRFTTIWCCRERSGEAVKEVSYGIPLSERSAIIEKETTDRVKPADWRLEKVDLFNDHFSIGKAFVVMLCNEIFNIQIQRSTTFSKI